MCLANSDAGQPPTREFEHKPFLLMLCLCARSMTSMSSKPSGTKTTHPLERILAIVGATICLVVTVILWASIGALQSMWPLPGLYFLEMAVLSVVCVLLVFFNGDLRGRLLLWGAVGIFIGFSILGAWSVGFIYLPVAIIFSVIAIRSDLRNKRHIAVHIGVCLIAGIVQVALMLAVIRSHY